MTLRTNGQRIKNINFIALEKIQLFDFRVKYKEFNMHYYKFNIADYRKDTIHLNRTEYSHLKKKVCVLKNIKVIQVH